ncbi:MAG: hypothetical protein COY81_03305 [Candidatus Pacebacteria bacterium CG_4_10_14_0_8_um_filter_43_12]|nr:MAG: hypothetical protein COY81_03305 [Candidatus Pacebacteria bacterium CG_4_10_14_0_8_um_filter_43_12]
MPWLVWPKKDAYSAKVVGELSNSFDPAVSEWGNPPCRSTWDPVIYYRGGTWGTEISKYPVE